MKWMMALFFVSLLFGTVVSVMVYPGITLYLHDFFLVLLVASSILSKTKQKLRAKLMPNIMLFGIVSVLSLLINSYRITLPELGISSLYLIRWFMYAGMYIIVLGKQIDTTLWVAGLFSVGVGYALLGIIQFFLYPNLRNLMYLGWDPHYYRLFSTILDPNFAGILFVFTVMLGYYLYQQTKDMRVLGLTSLSFAALVLTFSRSSYVAFFAGSLTYALLEKKWKAFFIGILMFVVLFIAIPNPGRAYLRMDRTATSLARIENWKESFALFEKSPLFGHGFNTLRYIREYSIAGAGISHAGAGVDNSFLFILATTGIIGFTIYGWLIMSIFRLYSNVTRVSKDGRIFGRMGISILVSLIVHSQFVNSFFFPQVMIFLWIILGVAEVQCMEKISAKYR